MADLSGLNTVIANLQKEVKKIEGRSLKGLIRAGLIVLRSVETKEPLTPLDLTNLRASRTLITSNGGVPMGPSPTFKGKKAGELSTDHSSFINGAEALLNQTDMPGVALGFSAKYAAEVHEMTGVDWQRKGSGGKFFEKAIDNNIDEMVKVISKEAKIK